MAGLDLRRLRGAFDPNQMPVVNQGKPLFATPPIAEGIPEERIGPTVDRNPRAAAPVPLPQPQVIQSAAPTPVPPVVEEEVEQPESIEQTVSRLYQPDTRATDQFMQHMEDIPIREEPNRMRKIAAGLTQLGPEGRAGSNEILYGNYNRNMADFNAKAGHLKDLASAERSGNVNERMMLSQMLRSEQADRTAQTASRRVDEQERAGESRRKLDEIRVAIARIREDKRMPEADKARLIAGYAQDLQRMRQSGAIESIGARTEADRELAEINQGYDVINQEDDQEHDAEMARLEREGRIALEAAGDVNEPGSADGEEDENPTQTKVRQYNAARQVLNSTPAFRKYLRLGNPGTNDFQLRMPPNGDQVEFNYIRDKIYGKPKPAAAPAPTPRPAPAAAPRPTLAPGTVFTRGPDGKLIVRKAE